MVFSNDDTSPSTNHKQPWPVTTLTTLNLTLTDPHIANLMRKYGIEMCHIKNLPLGIYSPSIYLYLMHIDGKQSIQHYGVCIPCSVSSPHYFFMAFCWADCIYIYICEVGILSFIRVWTGFLAVLWHRLPSADIVNLCDTSWQGTLQSKAFGFVRWWLGSLGENSCWPFSTWCGTSRAWCKKCSFLLER